MSTLPAPCLLALTALFPLPALAQSGLRPDLARLESFTLERDGQAFACFELEGARGSTFHLFGCLAEPGHFDPERAFRIGTGRLDAQGAGRLRLAYPRDLFGPGFTLQVVAAHGGAPWIGSAPSTLRLTGNDDCDTLDVDERPGLETMQKGEVVTDQYRAAGLAISARNNHPSHPDKAIVFDPAGDSTGADPDLHTPLGKLLILAENDVDRDGDGRVDVPDDEANGGELFLDFSEPIQLESITLVDIDDARPSRLHLAHPGGGTTSLDLVNRGDGSVQELELALFATDVSRLTVELGGSGGVALMRYTPCPVRLDFDETSAGVPLSARRAGELVSDQYRCQGVTISARNNVAAHPQKALLFDSSHPTGGDDDLLSPGPGPGNDVALGLLLVVAENVLDADGDGFVDQPDDEGAGGQLAFDFAGDVRWYGATLLDIDDGGPSSFDLFDAGGNLLRRIDLPNRGDNSKQVIALSTPVERVRRAVLRLGGSGGLAEMVYCPADAPAPR